MPWCARTSASEGELPVLTRISYIVDVGVPPVSPQCAPEDSEKLAQELPRGALANGATPLPWTSVARSTAESAVEERGKEVLGLAQRLPLHRTQALHSLNQGREFLLEPERGQWRAPLAVTSQLKRIYTWLGV